MWALAGKQSVWLLRRDFLTSLSLGKTNKSGAVKRREKQHALHASVRVGLGRFLTLGLTCQAALFQVITFLLDALLQQNFKRCVVFLQGMLETFRFTNRLNP